MHVEDDTVGVAFSTVLLDRVDPQERATLTTTDAALGRALRADGNPAHERSRR
jgi:chorismate-pyruvate lyase